MGSAAIAAGLLLVLTAMFAAWLPGRATFARPGISNPVRAFLLAPVHPTTWYANGAILLGGVTGVLGAAVIITLVSVGLSILLAGVGVLLIVGAIEGSRILAWAERRRLFLGEPVRPVAHPYRPLRGGLLQLLRAEFADENRWRDVIYVAINLPLAALELLVVGLSWAVALVLLTSPVWYDAGPVTPAGDLLGPLDGRDAASVTLRVLGGVTFLGIAASLSQLVLALHRGVVTALLCTSAERELRRQVETLRQSREAVLDVEASELHRIERDLHDGAQQRLVALTIDLGLAGEKLESDPAAARELIAEGQEQARQALAEIRQLVRGIAPSILLDRGLRSALESVAGRGPVRTVVVGSLAQGERLPASVERAAYFVASEALANVARHAGASRCEVRLDRLRDGSGDRLGVEVWDDGRGGAGMVPGGGLAGLESRVTGVDGTLVVSSPAGGPTSIRAEIPIPAGAQEPR